MRLLGVCRPLKLWAAPLSYALTKLEHWQQTKCQFVGYVSVRCWFPWQLVWISVKFNPTYLIVCCHTFPHLVKQVLLLWIKFYCFSVCLAPIPWDKLSEDYSSCPVIAFGLFLHSCIVSSATFQSILKIYLFRLSFSGFILFHHPSNVSDTIKNSCISVPLALLVWSISFSTSHQSWPNNLVLWCSFYAFVCLYSVMLRNLCDLYYIKYDLHHTFVCIWTFMKHILGTPQKQGCTMDLNI